MSKNIKVYSPEKLLNAGIKWTLTGTSESRMNYEKSDEEIALNTKAALDGGMNVMVCVGERLEDRKIGKTLEVCARQL